MKDDEFKTKTKLEHDGNVSVSSHNPFEDLTIEELRALISENEEFTSVPKGTPVIGGNGSNSAIS